MRQLTRLLLEDRRGIYSSLLLAERSTLKRDEKVAFQRYFMGFSDFVVPRSLRRIDVEQGCFDLFNAHLCNQFQVPLCSDDLLNANEMVVLCDCASGRAVASSPGWSARDGGDTASRVGRLQGASRGGGRGGWNAGRKVAIGSPEMMADRDSLPLFAAGDMRVTRGSDFILLLAKCEREFGRSFRRDREGKEMM
ncbi:hypothetical protein STAS_09376 [Striga asiatica]|uniref:Uncharacterized protein n=1 Tax=Striga asiatica TaxID=4170 RepID=A0A5A7PKW4_STRAF|nr:hypothetical protein STAS_09376 [Striga asiatica]